MKILTASSPPESRTSRRRIVGGMMLVECIAYIGLFFLVMGVTFKLFYVCWDNSKSYRRSADAITAALNAGERWREDVRAASGPLRVDNPSGGEVLFIPEKSGEVAYRFSDGALWRRVGPDAGWIQALPRVKSSRMETDPRGRVTAWRWEVELTVHQKETRMLPLFTFEAVPQTNQQP